MFGHEMILPKQFNAIEPKSHQKACMDKSVQQRGITNESKSIPMHGPCHARKPGKGPK